ncbi:MAG TPA: DUF433 domain-containing protein [Gemmataceae bacterium]|nr:DUF433 domain-containing protein [Gemmataceae bacterium]
MPPPHAPEVVTVVYRAASRASWVEKAGGVCGGDARIRRTRIPVWVLVGYRQAGLSEDALLRVYPSLTAADLACAWEYYASHPDEVDAALLRHEAA